MRNACLTVVVLLLSIGCDSDPSPDAGTMRDASVLDAGPFDASASDGGADGGEADASAADGGTADAGRDAGPTGLEVVLPTAEAEVLDSVAMRLRAPGAARVRVTEPASGATCDAEAPWFECLLDLSAATPGALTIDVVALDETDTELENTTVSLTRRTVEVPCTGNGTELSACLVARAGAGDAAGFAGITYLNADDAHARVNTSDMEGIDARVLDQPPAMPLDDVRLGIMNESRSWSPTGGWCSMPRCNPFSRQRAALMHYEANVLYFCPEHRDHGSRDFYQWMAPFFQLSQGSSSSERDEVARALRALAAMPPAARDRAETTRTIAPLVSMLIRRARHASDVAYLAPEAHATALTNSEESLEAIITLASAMRSGELPPVARVSIESATFGSDDWGMTENLNTPYAVGFAPTATPESPPAGEFEIEVSLEPSTDPNERALVYFPVVLRSAGSDTTVEQVAPDRWIVRGDYPEDTAIMTNGHERTVSRVTVGFFPHNGIWLGAPAYVSVGGRDATEIAPNSNNLD